MQTPTVSMESYAALVTGPAWVDRSYRAIIEVTGKDRVSWTHNLTTNQVKTLAPGEGNYAFVLNVQGRILFDVVVLVRNESIWMDLDSRFLGTALAHFNRYIIMEDVQLKDRSNEFRRVGLVGRGAKSLLAKWGAGQAAAMPAHAAASFSVGGASLDFTRWDFCGEFGVDLFIPRASAGVIQAIESSAAGAKEAEVQVRRIEAGIPWPGAEITDEYLPAETRQIERAVSFQKGCYLGQEIVERMRARRVVARLLSGLTLEGESVPMPGSEIIAGEGAVVGRITSSCWSLGVQRPIALSYIKAGSAAIGATLGVRCGQSDVPAVVTALPFVAAGS